jgi:phytoene dehydrogenase-like protein
MPPFLDNTPSSRELRAACIQHVISEILAYRIFDPFLFTLERRFNEADHFFQELSMDLRRGSTRREAFWRQQTPRAAFTTFGAEQSINVTAALTVDEIMDRVKDFADPRRLDDLLKVIRQILKLSAEIWRLARVERELILATMSHTDYEDVRKDDWEEYTCGRSVINYRKPSDPDSRVLLRLFPRIYREAAHDDFNPDPEKVNPCVYSRGMVLLSDSPSVLARIAELAPSDRLL